MYKGENKFETLRSFLLGIFFLKSINEEEDQNSDLSLDFSSGKEIL